MKFEIRNPELQVDFTVYLQEIRQLYLQDALLCTIRGMEIQLIDDQLHKYVSKEYLARLASAGLRGELMFPMPCVLEVNPQLLGYYRLLLGYSQKEFYQTTTGFGMYKSFEEKGTINKEQKAYLLDFCKALIKAAEYMLSKLSHSMLSASFFDQLTLLTLGPQLRGSANVRRGTASIKEVFDIIRKIVHKSIISENQHTFVIKNSSGRRVLIQFAADPDIIIKEELAPGKFKNLVATEVKGGQDYSNIHNRVGEAEKSHQKARKEGYVEFWTVVNVDNININMAHNESPTTNKFFRLSELQNEKSADYEDFKMGILSAVGI